MYPTPQQVVLVVAVAQDLPQVLPVLEILLQLLHHKVIMVEQVEQVA